MADISGQEMTGSIRRAAGQRGDVTPGLGLPNEARHVINAATEAVRNANGQVALEALANGAPGFERGGWEAVLQEKLLTGFAADGSRIAANPAEAIRLNQVRDTMRAYEDFMQHGFDHLSGTAAEIAHKRTILRQHMHDFLASNPSFRTALAPAATPHTIPQAIVDEALRDDGLGRELATTLNTKFDPNTMVADENTFFTARKDVEDKTQERNELVRQQTEANDRLTQATADRTNFNTAPTYTISSIAGTPLTTRNAALGTIEGAMSVSANPDVNRFRANLEEKFKLLKQRNRVPPPTPAEIGTIQTALTNLEVSLNGGRTDAPDGAKCREFEALFNQQHGITTRRDEASKEVARLNGEIAKKDIEIAKEKAKLDLVSGKKRATGGDFGLVVEQSFYEAAKKHLAEKAKNFIDNYRIERGKATKDAVSEQERVMDRYLEGRWVTYRPQSFWHQWRPSRIDIRRAQARADFTTIMGAGVDNVIADALRRAGISAHQASLMMQDDKEPTSFMQRKRAEVIGKALAAYVVSGGRLRQHQLNAIAMSPYGADAMQKMQQEVTAMRDRTSTAQTAGLTRGVPPDLRERMIQGTPSWLATQTTMRILLSPMHLMRPLAIRAGKVIGTIDVS